MRDLSLEQFSDLVGTIYDAGTDPEKWHVFLAKLDTLLDSVYLSIYGHDTRTDLCLDLLATKYSDEHLAAYVEHYCQTNLFIPVLLNAPLMKAQPSEKWVPKEDLVRTEFYNDFLRPQEDIGTGGGGVLFNDDGRLLILSGQVRFPEEEKARQLIDTINLIAPHVRRAFEIHRMLQGQRVMDAHYREALDKVTNAVFLIDRQGRISHHNRAADELLRQGDVFYLDPWRTLRSFDPTADSALAATLSAIRANRYDHLSSAIPLSAKDRERTFAATLAPFRPKEEVPGIFGDFVADSVPIAILTVVDPAARCDSAQQALTALYHLTPAELALVDGLSAGKDLKTYAEARSVSLHTVRSQLKSVFAKTDTHKQSEIVALVGRLSSG